MYFSPDKDSELRLISPSAAALVRSEEKFELSKRVKGRMESFD